MKSRERVLASIERRDFDRIPADGWFRPEFWIKLHDHFNTENNEDILKALGTDIRQVVMDPPKGFEPEKVLAVQNISKDFENFYATVWDEWNIKRKAGSTDEYWHFTHHPLEHVELDEFEFPNIHAPGRFDRANNLVKEFKDEYFISGNGSIGLFEHGWALRGYRNFIRDLYTNQKFIERLLDRLLEWKIEQDKYFADIGVDMIFLSDDLGMQTGLMLSPDIIRKFFIPRYRKWFEELKKKDVFVMFHTDGNVEPIIPDLIDAGIDILNPIQPECMDPIEIKKLYGEKIAFHGTISLQKTLPFGSTSEVKKEVLDRIETLGFDGGLILAPCHTVDQHVPVENVITLYETIQK
jgi:hypothetical protein